MKEEEYTTTKVEFIGGMRMSEEIKTIDWKAIGKERQQKYEQKINDWNLSTIEQIKEEEE
jgi:hypothetical protein